MQIDKETKKYVDLEALKYYTEKLKEYMKNTMGTEIERIDALIGLEENEEDK